LKSFVWHKAAEVFS